jgi:hypothetical protein
MNLHSAVFTGLVIAAFAWAMAFEAQAQTATPPPAAQETPVAPDATQPADLAKAIPKHAKKHRSQRMPTDDSTPAEKAVTDRLNAQQLEGLPPSPHQTGMNPEPGAPQTSGQ